MIHLVLCLPKAISQSRDPFLEGSDTDGTHFRSIGNTSKLPHCIRDVRTKEKLPIITSTCLGVKLSRMLFGGTNIHFMKVLASKEW